MLTPAEVDEVVWRIVARADPEAVIVFGSYAKGTPTVSSDLDLLVIMETDRPMAKRADDIKPMFTHALIPVDVHVYTPEEVEEYGKTPYTFIHSVLASGQVAYQKSRVG